VSKLKKSQGTDEGGLGKFRLIYAKDEPYEVWIVKVNESSLHKRFSYPTHRVYEDGTVQAIHWTPERLHDAMQPMLRRYGQQYGADWCLEIREPTPEPSPENLIRMRTDRLVARVAAALPKVEMPQKPPLPTREMLEEIGRVRPSIKAAGGIGLIVSQIELPQPPPGEEIAQPGPRGATVEAVLGATGDYLDGAETKVAGGPSDCSDLWASRVEDDNPKPAPVVREPGSEG